MDLEALRTEVGMTDASRAKLFKVFDISSWGDVRAEGMYDTIVRMLEEKRQVSK